MQRYKPLTTLAVSKDQIDNSSMSFARLSMVAVFVSLLKSIILTRFIAPVRLI